MEVAAENKMEAPSEESMIVFIFIMFMVLIIGTLHGFVLRIRGEI